MRTPTSRLASSTKKRGEWLGSALFASRPGGVAPIITNRPGAFCAKNEKSSPPVPLGITIGVAPGTRCRLGTILAVRAGSFTVGA
ncbi:hypothetical protein D3C87_660610 [compost metagenome]